MDGLEITADLSADAAAAVAEPSDVAALEKHFQDLLLKHAKGRETKGVWRCATPTGVRNASGVLVAVKLRMACSTDAKPVMLSSSNYSGTIGQHAKRCGVCAPVSAIVCTTWKSNCIACHCQDARVKTLRKPIAHNTIFPFATPTAVRRVARQL